MTIYDLIPTLRNRINMLPKSRYVIVFLYRNIPCYFFDLIDNYLPYQSEMHDFDFIVAYRRSGKLISYCYEEKKIEDIKNYLAKRNLK